MSRNAINRPFNKERWDKLLSQGYKKYEFKSPAGTVVFTTIAKSRNGAFCNYRYYRKRMKELFPKRRITIGKLSQRKRDYPE